MGGPLEFADQKTRTGRVAAPEERILAEIDFYQMISSVSNVRSEMPKVLAFDRPQRILVLEDLGEAADYLSLYQVSCGSREEVDSVFGVAIQWLTRLHTISYQGGNAVTAVGCQSLRELNHQHIFTIPVLDPPAIDLDQVCAGLTAASRWICDRDVVSRALEILGKRYLLEGGSLLHGDYYPGSWLDTANGFRVIDPEFCFAGPPEFDLGVAAAHWIFCGAETNVGTIQRVCELYGKSVSQPLVLGFAGAELIRRLIGVAQLPLSADLEQRVNWLQCGQDFLIASQRDTLDSPT